MSSAYFVFPGGKVDLADSRIVPPHDLHPQVMKRLRDDAGPEECGPFIYTRYGKSIIEQI